MTQDKSTNNKVHATYTQVGIQPREAKKEAGAVSSRPFTSNDPDDPPRPDPPATMSQLRQMVFDRANDFCEWPKCHQPAEELAHLEPRGMGGRPSVDRADNLMALCGFHHDILDGRTHAGLRRAMLDLLTHIIAPGPYDLPEPRR